MVVTSFVLSALLLPAVPLTSVWRVVPGSSVGPIHLGENLLPVKVSAMGFDPSSSERGGRAASGHIWHVWPGRDGHELGIYTVRGSSDSAVHPSNIVQEIRVTSPEFHTIAGLHPGALVPKMKGFAATNDGNGVTVLDDVKSGFAVEVKNGRCTALVIHAKGRKFDQLYIRYPYTTRAKSRRHTA